MPCVAGNPEARRFVRALKLALAGHPATPATADNRAVLMLQHLPDTPGKQVHFRPITHAQCTWRVVLLSLWTHVCDSMQAGWAALRTI